LEVGFCTPSACIAGESGEGAAATQCFV
jgi:hypothetical protein